MYNLRISEEQVAIRDSVREFVAGEITPIAIKPERLEPFDVPLAKDLVDAAGTLGLRTLSILEDAGGASADTLTCCMVAEELAAGDVDVATVLAWTSTLGGLLFNELMNDEQRGRFLDDFITDNDYHLALADREPEMETSLGIDYHRESGDDTSISTIATQNGDGGLVINGTKIRISNAPLAKLFAGLVNIDGRKEVVLVPADTNGVTINETPRNGGWYHGSCGDVTFSDCTVPSTNMLDLDAVHKLTGPYADFMLPILQAINLGVGRAAYDAAVDYSSVRVQGGRLIIEHQAIGAKLAEVAISLEMVRNAVWRAAWTCDNPDSESDGNAPLLPQAKISQVVTAQSIYRATKDSAECFGAMGVMRDMPLQKYIHVSRVFLHTGDGVSDAKLRIAEVISGHSRE
jgi:alkylation response protein AidB-like acyl-CoA dehydrogenase